jgi:hypothetical protein
MARNTASWTSAMKMLTPIRAPTIEAALAGEPEPAEQLVLSPAHQRDRRAEGGAGRDGPAEQAGRQVLDRLQ